MKIIVFCRPFFVLVHKRQFNIVLIICLVCVGNVLSSVGEGICGDARKLQTPAGAANDSLEDISIASMEQFYKELIGSERYVANIMLISLIAIAMLLLGAQLLVSGKIVNYQVQNKLTDATTRITNVNENNIKELNKDYEKFKKGIEKQIVERDKNTQQKILDFESKFEGDVATIKSQIYDAVGRIYEETDSPSTAALWYLRALSHYVDVVGGEDQFLKVLFDKIASQLKLSNSDDHTTSEYVSEMHLIIENLEESKFKKQKSNLGTELDEALSRPKTS